MPPIRPMPLKAHTLEFQKPGLPLVALLFVVMYRFYPLIP